MDLKFKSTANIIDTKVKYWNETSYKAKGRLEGKYNFRKEKTKLKLK